MRSSVVNKGPLIARIIFALVFLTTITPRAFACTCGYRSLATGFAYSDDVFLAEVLDSVAEGEYSNHDFRMIETFKGRPDYQRLKSGGQCGFRLSAGQKYLVFADDTGNTSECKPTMLEDRALNSRALFALRRFRDGETDRVYEPWVFRGSPKECVLSISAHRENPWLLVRLVVSATLDELPKLTALLALPYDQQDQATGLSINGERFEISSATELDLKWFTQRKLMITGHDVLLLAGAMNQHASVEFGPLAPNPEWAESPAFGMRPEVAAQKDIFVSIPMQNLDSSAQDFLSCNTSLSESRAKKESESGLVNGPIRARDQ